MPKLVLVRHSHSEPRADRPAAEWGLSEEGRERCLLLAERLSRYELSRIYSSSEPKAVETASTVSMRLGIPHEIRVGLHEHERDTVPFVSQDEFDAAVARLLLRPDELVFGEETAAAASARFKAAMNGVLSETTEESLAVVTHGTVMSLFVAERSGADPLSLWKRLGMPSFVVLSRPELQVVELVEELL